MAVIGASKLASSKIQRTVGCGAVVAQVMDENYHYRYSILDQKPGYILSSTKNLFTLHKK